MKEKKDQIERINDKIGEIEEFLEMLYSLEIGSLEDYVSNFKNKAICERYFEKIVEAVVDLAFLAVKEKIKKIPEEDEQSFIVLAKAKIINEKLANKLKEAKSMRNIIAHEYGKINDELVYHSIKDELEKDVREFLDSIKKSLEENPKDEISKEVEGEQMAD